MPVDSGFLTVTAMCLPTLSVTPGDDRIAYLLP